MKSEYSGCLWLITTSSGQEPPGNLSFCDGWTRLKLPDIIDSNKDSMFRNKRFGMANPVQYVCMKQALNWEDGMNTRKVTLKLAVATISILFSFSAFAYAQGPGDQAPTPP